MSARMQIGLNMDQIIDRPITAPPRGNKLVQMCIKPFTLASFEWRLKNDTRSTCFITKKCDFGARMALSGFGVGKRRPDSWIILKEHTRSVCFNITSATLAPGWLWGALALEQKCGCGAVSGLVHI